MAKLQNSTVSFEDQQNNILAEFDNCTISAINSGFMLNGGTNNTLNTQFSNVSIYGGLNNVITSNSSSFVITGEDNNTAFVRGSNNFIKSEGNVDFLNGTGFNTILTTGGASIFGENGLNMVLQARNVSALYVASAASNGNETLDGGSSTADVVVYANTVPGANSSLVAKTGSGDDLLAAGTGKSTLSGGAGSNLFLFNKNTDAGGSTVIGDFTQSATNKIWLANYGFNQDDVSNLLSHGYDSVENGHVYANLDLGNHQLQIQDVSVSSLKVSQFNL